MERRQRIFAAAALALSLSACGALQAVQARQLAREGNALYRASQYRPASEKYRRAIGLDPAMPNVHLNLGYALSGVFDPGSNRPEDRQAASEALAALDAHLEQVPTDDQARAFRNRLLVRAAPGDPAVADRAFAQLTALLGERPDDLEAQRLLAALLVDCRRWTQAVEHYEPLLRARPDDVETMRILALVADKAGHTQAAVDWYRRRAEAAKDPGQQAAFYFELGLYAWSALRSSPQRASGVEALVLADQGIEACRRAMALEPLHVEAMAWANLLYLERAAAEPTGQGRYFDQRIAHELRTLAARTLQARRRQEAAARSAGALEGG